MMSTQPRPDKGAEVELLPCPFCGGAARIESNRDWHRIFAAHDDECVFDADDHALMYPAQPGYLIQIAEDWNRRSMPEAVAEELPPRLTNGQIEALWAKHADTAKPGERRIAFGRAVEQAVIASQARASVPAAGAVQQPTAAGDVTNARIVEVLASMGVDSEPSKYGFEELQVRTTVSTIRKVVEKFLAAPAPGNTAQPADDGRKWIVLGGRRMGRTYLAKLEREAARYRWLRDKSEPGVCAFYLSVGQAFKDVKFARETVDDAIDAQIATMQSAKGAKESAEGSGS